MGRHPRPNFPELKGFRDVVYSSRSKSLYLVFRTGQTTDKNHRNASKTFVGLKLDAYFEPIHFRHIDI